VGTLSKSKTIFAMQPDFLNQWVGINQYEYYTETPHPIRVTYVTKAEQAVRPAPLWHCVNKVIWGYSHMGSAPGGTLYMRVNNIGYVPGLKVTA
jgi:hypothetical protein